MTVPNQARPAARLSYDLHFAGSFHDGKPRMASKRAIRRRHDGGVRLGVLLALAEGSPKVDLVDYRRDFVIRLVSERESPKTAEIPSRGHRLIARPG